MCIIPNYVGEMEDRAGKPCPCSIHTADVIYFFNRLTCLYDIFWPFPSKKPKQEKKKKKRVGH